MKTYEQNPEPDKTLEASMKWEEAFKSLLDEIYYPGYSQSLIEENPSQYQLEYNSFINLYDGPQ